MCSPGLKWNESIKQITDEVEIIIVDGASGDGSKEKIEELNPAPAQLKYFYEDINSGVDRDFDKSVEYASGQYCWLFSDDDLIEKNAISTVINSLKSGPELLVVNSSIHTKFFEKKLCNEVLGHHGNIYYEGRGEQAFLDLASYLSFIGAIIIKRDFWLSREREIFHGSDFAHLGVIFQAPLPQHIYFLSKPLIKIRYGNSDWAPRGFEIWTQQWPKQVMLLDNLPYAVRKKISRDSTLDLFKFCLLYRAMGSYTVDKFQTFVRGNYSSFSECTLHLILLIPIKLLNILLTLWFMKNDKGLVNIYRLSNSSGAPKFSRWLAKNLVLGGGMGVEVEDLAENENR